MRRTALIVIFLAALVVAGIAFVPATLIDARLAARTAGELRLTEASGTVWRGRGMVGNAAGTWRAPVAWHVDPTEVLRGVVPVTLVPTGTATTPRGTIHVRRDGFTATDVALDIPAIALATFLPARNAPVPGGTLTLTTPTLTVADGRAQGTLDVRWNAARVVLGEAVADLGTVRLAVAPQGQGQGGTVTNEGGNVKIEATLAYRAPTLDVDATLTPGPDAPPAITRALAAAGTPDGNGRVRVTWRATLR